MQHWVESLNQRIKGMVENGQMQTTPKKIRIVPTIHEIIESRRYFEGSINSFVTLHRIHRDHKHPFSMPCYTRFTSKGVSIRTEVGSI